MLKNYKKLFLCFVNRPFVFGHNYFQKGYHDSLVTAIQLPWFSVMDTVVLCFLILKLPFTHILLLKVEWKTSKLILNIIPMPLTPHAAIKSDYWVNVVAFGNMCASLAIKGYCTNLAPNLRNIFFKLLSFSDEMWQDFVRDLSSLTLDSVDELPSSEINTTNYFTGCLTFHS